MKDAQSLLENIKNLPKLRMLVEKTQKDLKASQQVIPFDQVGDYMQCLPIPGQPNSFITIQPFGHKNSDVKNRNFGKLVEKFQKNSKSEEQAPKNERTEAQLGNSHDSADEYFRTNEH